MVINIIKIYRWCIIRYRDNNSCYVIISDIKYVFSIINLIISDSYDILFPRFICYLLIYLISPIGFIIYFLSYGNLYIIFAVISLI